MADYLTTKTKAKAYMKKTDTTDDALITSLVKSASKMIQNYLNRDIIQATYTDELYDGTGTNELFTKQYPVTTLTSVKLYDPIANSNVYTYVVYSEYVLDTDGEFITMWGGWAKGFQKYKITYVAGYAVSGETSSVPEDIEMACNMLVSFLFSGIGVQGIRAWRAGSYSEDRVALGVNEGGIPPEIRGILDLHRRPVI